MPQRELLVRKASNAQGMLGGAADVDLGALGGELALKAASSRIAFERAVRGSAVPRLRTISVLPCGYAVSRGLGMRRRT